VIVVGRIDSLPADEPVRNPSEKFFIRDFVKREIGVRVVAEEKLIRTELRKIREIRNVSGIYQFLQFRIQPLRTVGTLHRIVVDGYPVKLEYGENLLRIALRLIAGGDEMI
jgi:hypothetical protein